MSSSAAPQGVATPGLIKEARSVATMLSALRLWAEREGIADKGTRGADPSTRTTEDIASELRELAEKPTTSVSALLPVMLEGMQRAEAAARALHRRTPSAVAQRLWQRVSVRWTGIPGSPLPQLLLQLPRRRTELQAMLDAEQKRLRDAAPPTEAKRVDDAEAVTASPPAPEQQEDPPEEAEAAAELVEGEEPTVAVAEVEAVEEMPPMAEAESMPAVAPVAQIATQTFQ